MPIFPANMKEDRRNSFRQKYTIRPLEADPHDRLKAGVLTDLIQQAAWTHADKLGVGTPFMISKGYTWVLTRLQVSITRMPVYPGEVFIETWPSGVERLFTFRHFSITDSRGDVCGQARSAWMVVDLSRKRAIKPPDFIKEIPHTIEPGNEELYASVPDAPADPCLSADILVRRQDIDINDHVNNNTIIQWLYECLDRPGQLRSLDVRFKAECKLGDRLVSEAQIYSESAYAHRVVRPEDDREIAVARTTWH
ncbi:MAG: acyl-ACP thioesterase domain-containing protein [Cyclobacteriaceae bacterium]